MTKSMTSGSPIKIILAFCLPLLVGNIFQQLYNMVDSIIVGKFVGVNALAAVGSTGSINFLVLGFALGLCSGFGIPIAQAFGAQDEKGVRRYVINALYLCVIASVVITMLTMIFTPSLLHWMKTPEDIYQGAYTYISIVFNGTTAIIFYNVLSSILRALGDSKTPLLFLAISSILNIILDLLFVTQFHMAEAGVAYATVISQGVSAILCAIYMKKRYAILKFKKEEMKFDIQACLKLLGIGVPMALQFSITAVGTVILQVAVNGLGSAKVAAITAAMKIQNIVTQPMDTIGVTMATYCGQNLGARKMDRIEKGLKQAFMLSFGYCILSCVVIWPLGKVFLLLLVDAQEVAVINDASLYMRIDSALFTLLGFLFIARNALQGLGYSSLTMLAGIAEMIGRSFVALFMVQSLGYIAVCISDPIAWLLADIILSVTLVIKLKTLRQELAYPVEESVF